jgi:hypothetical protein
MKSYIIRLSDFPNSIEWSKKAYMSAKSHSWDIHFFEGVNGQKETLVDYNIKINKSYKKAIKSFERIGTVGCFLSHYKLWKKCTELNEPICILEHDVIIRKEFPILNFTDVCKLFKGPSTKGSYLGDWWASGAAYCLNPAGADKLLNFVNDYGAMPADVMLNTGIVKLNFNNDNVVEVKQNSFSFTWEL